MQPHSFSQWMLATFNFRITVVYLTCLENLEGALTITAFFLSDCAKEWLSRSRLTQVLLLPFSQSKNSPGDKILVYICGQESNTK